MWFICCCWCSVYSSVLSCLPSATGNEPVLEADFVRSSFVAVVKAADTLLTQGYYSCHSTLLYTLCQVGVIRIRIGTDFYCMFYCSATFKFFILLRLAFWRSAYSIFFTIYSRLRISSEFIAKTINKAVQMEICFLLFEISATYWMKFIIIIYSLS